MTSSAYRDLRLKHPLAISIVSALIMILELSLIRFIPSEVKAISYFSNLILFASFFGLGIGCILSDTKQRAWLFPLGIFLLYIFCFLAHGIVTYDTSGSVHFWLQKSTRDYKPLLEIPLEISAILVFVLTSLPFFTLGHALANLMDQHERLTSYAWDIGGSLVGTILFTVSALFSVPPYVWIFLVPVVFALLLNFDMDRRVAYIVAGACFLSFAVGKYDSRWSPYYLVSYIPAENNLSVFVNSSFHQEAVNFNSTNVEYRRTAEKARSKFSAPYAAYQSAHAGASPQNILILGGGTGNDANIALLNGASSVTVIEIDPVIISLGREFNFLKPYDDPRVRIINDDGRHYLSMTSDRYDMVIFGTLDSQALLSGYANLRLENYIYTVESFQAARRVLNDGGMLGTYYSIWKDWFIARIYSTINEAFPGSLKLAILEDGYLFNAIIVAAKNLPGFNSDQSLDQKLLPSTPSTDNWPYIYLEKPTISRLYWTVIGVLMSFILVVFLMLKKRSGSAGVGSEFFLLGLAFTLLESAAIVRLALLFGTTWIVNSIVFITVLTMILLSNWMVMRTKGLPMLASWLGIGIVMACNILVPMDALLGLDFWARCAASFALIGIPVLLAGNCFSKMFAQQKSSGYALGVNLIGAMAGGLLEYISMLHGMRSVWLVLAMVYFAAFAVWFLKYHLVNARIAKQGRAAVQAAHH
ncbi:MAG: hypothetical protein NTY08_13345 [Proteobacteria bacterium]|nr:hypothetical protein [Pseudomonadota bacterium]